MLYQYKRAGNTQTFTGRNIQQRPKEFTRFSTPSLLQWVTCALFETTRYSEMLDGIRYGSSGVPFATNLQVPFNQLGNLNLNLKDLPTENLPLLFLEVSVEHDVEQLYGVLGNNLRKLSGFVLTGLTPSNVAVSLNRVGEILYRIKSIYKSDAYLLLNLSDLRWFQEPNQVSILLTWLANISEQHKLTCLGIILNIHSFIESNLVFFSNQNTMWDSALCTIAMVNLVQAFHSQYPILTYSNNHYNLQSNKGFNKFIKELYMDHLNGIVGKVTHDYDKLSLIQESLIVSEEEYERATSPLITISQAQWVSNIKNRAHIYGIGSSSIRLVKR